MMPGIRADHALVRLAMQVPPADRLEREGPPQFPVGPRVALPPVLPDRSPGGLGEPSLVAVAALGHDAGHRRRVGERQPPADGGAVAMHVHRVPGDLELPKQRRGQVGQRVKRVAELIGRRRVGQAEAEMIRRDHVVAVGEYGNEVAEHERACREAMQQQDHRCRGRSGVSVEDPSSLDGGVMVVDGRHSRSGLGGAVDRPPLCRSQHDVRIPQ
jgi:hypothetical protein